MLEGVVAAAAAAVGCGWGAGGVRVARLTSMQSLIWHRLVSRWSENLIFVRRIGSTNGRQSITYLGFKGSCT